MIAAVITHKPHKPKANKTSDLMAFARAMGADMPVENTPPPV